MINIPYSESKKIAAGSIAVVAKALDDHRDPDEHWTTADVVQFLYKVAHKISNSE